MNSGSVCRTMVTMKLNLEFLDYKDSGQWRYEIRTVSVGGAGTNPRQDGEQLRLRAIEFIPGLGEEEVSEGSKVVTYDVQIAKAS